MKKLLAIATLLLTAALPSAFAQNASQATSYVGTWKLDVAQSDFGPRPKPKSMTLYITKDTPHMLAWHETEIEANGKTAHESWSGPTDGSMHVLKSTGGNGQASFENNNGQITIHEKMANGVTADSNVTPSDGGNTMTENISGTANGQPFTETIVWHKVGHHKAKTM